MDRLRHIHNSDTMKLTKHSIASILSALALGAAAPAFAQEAVTSTTPSQAAAVDPGAGQIGTSYSELSFGYQKIDGVPKDFRDYELLTNGAVYREGQLGFDANFRYDYLTADTADTSNRRSTALFGGTGYLLETWGKPFVTADVGYAWQEAANYSRRSVAFAFDTGVEFQVLKTLALTPYLEYVDAPLLYNRGLPAINFPNHLFTYGVKATAKITKEWSGSLGADLDSHSSNDFGLKASVSYRF
jgi:hypothetical protein